MLVLTNAVVISQVGFESSAVFELEQFSSLAEGGNLCFTIYLV